MKNIFLTEEEIKNINEIYENTTLTPMLQEWKEVSDKSKKEYWENTIVLFQVGTFYETYFEDAIISSKILWLTLTSKNKSNKYSAPMAWIPLMWNIKEKIENLISKDFNVILVSEYPEYDESCSKIKILRKIEDIITPSTYIDIEKEENKFLLSIYQWINTYSISLVDITTGDIIVDTIYFNWIEDIYNILKFNVSEIIINREPDLFLKEFIEQEFKINYKIKNEYISSNDIDIYYKIKSIDDLLWVDNISNSTSLYIAFKYLLEIDSLKYINNNLYREMEIVDYIEKYKWFFNIRLLSEENKLTISNNSLKNLEVFSNIRGWYKYSLFHLVNYCLTAFWSRKLRNLFNNPLTDVNEINRRLNLVEYFFNNKNLKERIRFYLAKFFDIEKLTAKIHSNTILPADLLKIKSSLENINFILNEISKNNKIPEDLKELLNWLNNYDLLINKIWEIIKENPSNNLKEWWYIKEGFNKELDDFYLMKNNISILLKKEEEKLKEKFPLLKNFWLKVVNISQWFYVEINNSWVDTILKNYSYDFTFNKSLTNRTRYSTNTLKKLYLDFLDIENKIKEKEYEIFKRLRIDLSLYISILKKDATIIWELDIFTSLAYLAYSHKYSKPEIVEEWYIEIKNWRHPILEVLNWNIIENDLDFSNSKNLKIITWPNMWWKSTYLKQTALIILLAQIWSYVPASYCKLKPIKSIFTRIWSSDNLIENLSTFWVEMKEVWEILTKYNKDSLVIIDEIWRWTDISNWISITKSIIDYLIKKEKWYILFSTHYSKELIKLFNKEEFNKLDLLKVGIEFDNNWRIKFPYKITEGFEEDSYWIEIASLFNIPNEIIEEAKLIKNNLITK